MKWAQDVIKVEAPGGDVNRWTGASRSPDMSSGQLIKGRNKRAIVLDLKNPEARAPFERLVAIADVFVHNIRPKAASRLGIDYETVAALKPDIVYAVATGFGEDGPFVDRPAYDDLIQGASGLAALFGAITGTPRYAAERVGGQDSRTVPPELYHDGPVPSRANPAKASGSMYRCTKPSPPFMMNEHMQGQTFLPGAGPIGYSRLLTPHRRPYETADGHVCVVPYTQRHWRNFFRIAGRAELIDDPRFSTQSARTQNIDVLYGIVAAIIRTRTSVDWLAVLGDADIPVGPMNTLDDLLTCPHLDAVGMFPEIDHPSEGRMRHIKVPASLSKTPGGLYRHAEKLGQSTRAVLAELGFSEAEIRALHAAGATDPSPAG